MRDELFTVAVDDTTGEILVARFETAADREYIEATSYRLGQFVYMSRAHASHMDFDNSSNSRLRCALQIVRVKHEFVLGDEARELALRFATQHGSGGTA